MPRIVPVSGVVTGLALLASVFLTMFAVATTAVAESKVATTDENLVGRITVDRRVRLPQGGAAARIPVNIELTNTGTDDLVIKAPSICEVHNYHIVYPNNDLIATRGESDCPPKESVLELAPGETIYATNSLLLHRSLLETGRRYYVIYEFWGVRMRAPFVILEHE